MENLSHSRKPNRGSSHATLATKRTTSCNGAANLSSRTMYDDVFGGGPRFVTGGGGPTLSPRTEDYTEIFGGFHASRGASIPVLDLPSVSGSDEVMFDVRNPRFSYADVFGRFDNLDFPPSYEELMRQVNGGDDPDHDHDHDDYGDSSDEAWMQAETESLSEGSDHSGKYQHFSNGDYCEPIDTSMEFNMSYHKANVRSDRDVSNGITHVSQLHADPEYAYVIENPLQKMDKKDPPLDLTDDIDLEFPNGVVKKKHLRKTASHPSNRTIGEQTFTNDSTRRACRRTGSCSDEMFVTISNVNLRTVASDVPPPSRPPPFVNVENRDYQNGHHAASGGRMSDSSPPFFDVEIDASSAAAASAAAMKEAMDKAHAKLKSAKELLERKREGIKNSGKPGLKSDGKGKKERGDKTVEGSSYVTDERMQGMNVKEDSGMKTPVIDERQRAVKIQAADSLEGEKHFNAPERFVVEKLGKQYQSIQVFEETDGADEWQEAAQFFELVRTDHPKTVLELTNNEKVLLQGKKSHEQQHKAKMANFGASEQQLDSDKKIEAVREDHELEKVERDMKTAKESCERGEPVRISKPVKEARRHKGHEKKVKASQEVSEVEDDEQTPKAWKPVENGKKPTGADELAKREKQVNAQQKENKVEAGQAVEQRENGPQEKWTSRSVENPNRVDVFQKRKDDEKSWRETFEQEKNEINLQEVLEKVEKEKRLRDVLEQEEKGKRLKEAREREENARKYVLEQEEKERRLKEAREREENARRYALEQEEKERRLKEACEREENARRFALEQEEKEKRLKEAREREENTRRFALEQEEKEKRLKEAREREENARRYALEQEEKERRLKEAHEQEENARRYALEQEEKERRLKEAREREENARRFALEQEEKEKRLKEAREREENARRFALEQEEKEKRLKEAREREENAKKEEARLLEESEKIWLMALEQLENEKRLKQSRLQEENEKIEKEALEKVVTESEEPENRIKETCEKETIGKGFIEACEKEGTKKRIRKKWKENVEKILEEAVEQKDYSIPETDVQDTEDDVKGVVDMFEETEEPLGVNYVYQHAERCEKDRQLKITKGTHQRGEGEDSVVSGAVNKLDYSKILQENQLVGNDQNVDVPKGSGESTLEENGKIKAESNDSERKSEAMEKGEIDAKFKKDDATHLCHQDGGVKKAGDAGIGIGQRNAERINSIPVIDSDNDNQGLKFAYECERARNIKKSQVPSHLEEDWDNFVSAQVAKESVETGRKEDTVRASVLEEKVSIQRTAQSTEMKDRKVNGILRPQEKEAERLKRERELEKEHLRRIEEEREREREREKDRMAIDKAALEAYERGYAEVRERAERAAVERATAEARQRAMSEARDRLEKVSAEAREKSSIETRLRAERAAVERATAEARERAVEKAMAERAAFEARERVERSMSDKFSTSRNVGMRTSSSASDLKDQHVQSSGSRYPYSSTNNGVEIESAQRCKARLERYRRTAERAAKALEEKNMRDLLAQREQAERNRLAESLGADVKRWSSGKEGNLRALLSTLQYILGPESGWQPVPLTEVITSAAVKKAYRKATLCVHPDKLQQRGASIQQKYICEKVFDLLKEAWNKFNSEER